MIIDGDLNCIGLTKKHCMFEFQLKNTFKDFNELPRDLSWGNRVYIEQGEKSKCSTARKSTEEMPKISTFDDLGFDL